MADETKAANDAGGGHFAPAGTVVLMPFEDAEEEAAWDEMAAVIQQRWSGDGARKTACG